MDWSREFLRLDSLVFTVTPTPAGNAREIKEWYNIPHKEPVLEPLAHW